MNSSKTDRKELRKFAITVFCALGILGAVFLWRRGESGYLFWIIGVALLGLGLMKPRLLGPIHKVWMRLAFLIGFVMTHLILAAMYYLVFTPMGLVMRIFGRDPLRLKQDENAESYWIRRHWTEFAKERYEKMY